MSSRGRRPPPSDWPEYKPRRPGSGPWRPGGRRPFGATWWGKAWVEALEQRARLDVNRLPRGRTYARTGAVDGLSIGAGEVTARVQGSQRTPYTVRVRVRPFTDAEWERVLDSLTREIGHVAALLDGELPSGVAEDVQAVGLDLLPGAGEVQPRCTCPDWADPCKHSAAVCYLVADAVDEDPFQVLLLRGRHRDEVLAALRARRAGSAAGVPERPVPAGEPPDPGVPARVAWAATPDALPRLPVPPRRPGRPTVLAADPPTDSGLDIAALRSLAADAAARAWALALGGARTGLELDADADLARRAASVLGLVGPDGSATELGPAPPIGSTSPTTPRTSVAATPPVRPAGSHRAATAVALPASIPAPPAGSGPALAEMARRAGMSPRTLHQWARAWQQGAQAGLRVLRGSWDPPVTDLLVGRALLGKGATVRRNRVTRGDDQLRLGTDGRWYPYRRHGRTWEPEGPPLES